MYGVCSLVSCGSLIYPHVLYMYMYVTYQVIIACGTRLDIERNITYVAMSMYMLMYLYCMARST